MAEDRAGAPPDGMGGGASHRGRAVVGVRLVGDEYVEEEIDLNRALVRHPAATFIVRAVGDAFAAVGIRSGDALVVDRALAPRAGRLVVALIDGELRVREVIGAPGGGLQLGRPGGGVEAAVEAVEVWGVVTHAIHSFEASAADD